VNAGMAEMPKKPVTAIVDDGKSVREADHEPDLSVGFRQ
jgi:hypothetical protein